VAYRSGIRLTALGARRIRTGFPILPRKQAPDVAGVAECGRAGNPSGDKD
jgi:hypothetical protein